MSSGPERCARACHGWPSRASWNATSESPLHEPILAWFDVHARPLPWRRPDCTPWGVLVSEIMLQQTPVARVTPVWQHWLARWPTPTHLASEAPGEAVLMWGRLGYPRRALRLHAAAVAIVERHDGRVPHDHDALLALPGIGGYTAAAVASFAFGGRHPVLDTNVRRLLARAVVGTAQPAAASPTRGETDLAVRLLPEPAARAARWAAATMELGALVCTARAPSCTDCPVSGQCAWLRAGVPPAAGPARASQRYEGTDRWMRGLLLAVARQAAGPVTHATLRRAVPDDLQRDPAQRERALDSLVTDGLLEPLPRNRFRLPGR